MAKFCAQCGAPMDDDARFCGECGAPVESTDPVHPAEDGIPEIPLEPAAPEGGEPEGAPQGAPQAEEAPQWTAPSASDQPPREKKPLPKWAKPVIIAVAAVIVVVVALSLILKSVNDPEKVVDNCLSAMADGDFAAFSKVAVAADEELVLTEENTAPLFALYAESMSFRREVEDLLDEDLDLIDDGRDPNEGYLFDLRAEKRFLHTAYEVVIETCDSLEISGNLLCDVTLDGGQTVTLTADGSGNTWEDDSTFFSADYDLAQYGTGVLYDLLPGIYTVSGSVETASGAVLTAETQVEVSNEYTAYADLYFDYVTIEVANYYDIPVEFYVDGSLYGSLDGEGYFEMGPLNPEQTIEARADVGADEPMTETFSASEGYWSLSFVLCEVEINNDYAVPIHVLRDGEEVLTVEAGEYGSLSGLPSGTELTMELVEGVTEPVTYTCEDEYDYLYPEFAVTEDAQTGALSAVNTYVDEGLALFNAQDMAGLEALTVTDFSEDMIYALESMQSAVANVEGSSASTVITRTGDLELDSIYVPYSWQVDEMQESTVILECYIPMQVEMSMTAPDGTTASDSAESTDYYSFTLSFADGAWSILGNA